MERLGFVWFFVIVENDLKQLKQLGVEEPKEIKHILGVNFLDVNKPA